MLSIATIKDPGYYLRCVADRATQQELGIGRSLAASTIVAYELADGTRLEAAEVHGLRRQVKVGGLRLADGRAVALDRRDQVKVLRDGRKVTGYRFADGTEVAKEDAKRVTLSRKRLASYRLADGTELAKDQVRAITAGEAGVGLVDAEGREVAAALVAIRDQGNDRILGYYSEHGEAPGQWIGKGATEDLGLTGLVSLDENREVYERLMAGLHPVTAERLTKGQPGGERVAGFDHLFTMPKSVSMLWGLTPDPEVRAALEAAHQESVREAVAWYESQVSVARRGHASSGPGDAYPETIHHVPTTGLIGVMFEHRATRPGEDDPCGDPHLHTHVTLTNLAHGAEDGQWSAPDSTLLHTLARTVGAVEEASYRRLTTQKLAALGHHIEWTQPVNGIAEIKGLERRDWIEHFSRRSREADAALERKGLAETVASGPSVARDQAGHETRRAKESGLATSELTAAWQARGLGIGLGPEQLERALQMGSGGPTAEPELTPKLAAQLARELTEQENTFGLLDAIQVVANRARRGMTAERAVELARQLTHGATDQIVGLRRAGQRVIRRDDGRVVKVEFSGEMAESFTTKEVIRLEREVVAIAQQQRFAAVGVASEKAVAAAIKAYDDAHPDAKLGEDQVAMVTGLCTDGAGITLALSPAGHGKTSALRPATEAWQASGVTVLATAQMAARADELGAGVGLVPKRAMTIAALRQGVEGTPEHGGTRLPEGVVLLVDEAEVVDLRDLVALERHVRAAGGKLVLVGDMKQLGSIGPGAPLHELPKHVPTYELLDNRRQVAEWERDALKDLREGRTAEAVEAYNDHDRVVYAEGETRQAKADLVAEAALEYLAVRDRGESVALMAATHKHRLALNAAIRPELIRRGEIEAEGMVVGKLEIAVGDTLMMLKNNQKLGVRNSHLVHVERIDRERGTAEVRRPDGELVEADRNYLAKWAAHGYAETVNKAQGRTVDVGLTLADSAALSSQWGYTAASRGAKDNRIYFAGPRPVDPEHHLPEDEVPAQEKQRQMLAAGLTRDRSKELASQVIAALDRDDRMAVEAALAAAIQQTQREAAEHYQVAARIREVESITKARDAEAAKTPQEREADRRRKQDAELDQAHQEQDRGRQRTL
ncbi:MAG: MobF family relaxase [Candidatus Dormibacteria bacterium]